MHRAAAALALAAAVFGAFLFGGLAHPLLWQDEGETAMFARRILAYGYPKVHGPRNVVNEFGADAAAGVREADDAYIGKTWADFYLAAAALLWARRADDPYAVTFRLRLPFALVGALGVAAWWWALAPAFPGPRRRRLLAAAAYLGLCAASISLVLHLREVRYYGLLVLVVGLAVGVHLRRAVFARWGFARYAALQALVLVALFHVFYPAWAAATLLLGGERIAAAARGPDGRVRRALREAAPFALAALAVAPAAVYFETFDVARRFSHAVGAGVAVWASNLGTVALHLARHELLVPALVARAAAALAARRSAGAGGEGARTRRRCATGLLAFAAGYVAVVCMSPLVYERYVVVLSPLLALAFLLDAATLLDAAGPHRRVAGAGLVALALASVAVRAPEIAGRVAELREPVRGPVDATVAALRARSPDPSRLVIATNYEAFPLMFYLRSHVIVGLTLHEIVRERALEPDVLVPRGGWPRGLPELARFARRGHWEVEELPVRDVHFNDVPALSRSAAMPEVHRFRTAPLEPGAPRLRIYYRVPDGDAR